MDLIVEDGTGINDADSFVSLVHARDFADKYGITLPADDKDVEVSLRQAYLHLLTYEKDLQGSRATETQNNIFPRTGVKSNCVDVDIDSIPEAVKRANIYAASAISEGYSTNAVDTQEVQDSFSLEGVMSISYKDGTSTKLNKSIQGVDNSLYPLTKSGLAASPCGNGGMNTLRRDDYFYGC